MKKETNNKGFSLVELIVVIAIMAVLVGVLAPSLLKYVEKARAQRDASAAEEIRNAVEIALASEDAYNEVSPSFAGGVDVVPISSGLMAGNFLNKYASLSAEVASIIDFDDYEISSSTYGKATYTITIKSEDGAVTVTGNWTGMAN